MTRAAQRPGSVIPAAAMPAHPATSPASPERPGAASGAVFAKAAVGGHATTARGRCFRWCGTLR